MKKVNILFEFLQLSESSTHPYSFQLLTNSDGIQYFIHHLDNTRQTFFLNAIPFERIAHSIEIHATEVYNSVFKENQFCYFKYCVQLKNYIFDRAHRIEIMMTQQGFIDEIYIYSNKENELINYKDLPRNELDELIIVSEKIIQVFYKQLHQAQSTYITHLESCLEQQVEQLHKILFESEEGSALDLMFEFFETLLPLSYLIPQDYQLLYQNLIQIRHRIFSQSYDSMDASAENVVMPLADLQKMRNVLAQKIMKSKRLEDDSIVFNQEYLNQISELMDISARALETIYTHDSGMCPIEQFIHVIEYCQLSFKFKQMLLDFLKSQVILKNYTFFEATLEFCGHRVPMTILEQLAQQNRIHELMTVIQYIKPTHTMIHEFVYKLIQANHTEACIEINQMYPIDYLFVGADHKPMACKVFNLESENPIRSYLIEEHRQFITISFYKELLVQLQTLPWYQVREDLSLIRSILSKTEQSTNSSFSMFLSDSHTEESFKEKLLQHKLLQDKLKQKIMNHMSVDSVLSQVIMAMVYEQIKNFKKLVMLAQPHIILPVFERLDEAMKNLNDLLNISSSIKAIKFPTSRNFQQRYKNLQRQFKDLFEKAHMHSNYLKQQTEKSLVGVNQVLINSIYDLLDKLEEYRRCPNPEDLEKIQDDVRKLRERDEIITETDNTLITEIFYLPFRELMQSIELEIREYVSPSRLKI